MNWILQPMNQVLVVLGFVWGGYTKVGPSKKTLLFTNSPKEVCQTKMRAHYRIVILSRESYSKPVIKIAYLDPQLPSRKIFMEPSFIYPGFCLWPM